MVGTIYVYVCVCTSRVHDSKMYACKMYIIMYNVHTSVSFMNSHRSIEDSVFSSKVEKVVSIEERARAIRDRRG